jgi:hypothetical protein
MRVRSPQGQVERSTSVERNEPLPLYLVTHQGGLAVNENELIASRAAPDRADGPLVETLVEMTHHQAELLGRMVNVRAVTLAPSGDFLADDGTIVHVGADGAWHRPHKE